MTITSGKDWKLDWKGAEIEASLAGSLPEILRPNAQRVLDIANKTAPIDTGAMIFHSGVGIDGPEAWLVYSAPYALRQHEELSYKHKPGRRAKWLELTIEEQWRNFMGWVGADVQRWFDEHSDR